MWIVRIWLCLVIAAVALAQETPDRAVQVRGMVVDAVTGKPIAGATVILTGVRPAAPAPLTTTVELPGWGGGRLQEHELGTTTDEAGKFAFSAILGQEWVVQVRHEGYCEPLTGRVNVLIWGKSSAAPAPMTVRLDPQSVIEGRVSGHDREPLPGVFVEAVGVEIIEGRRFFRRSAGRDTDAQGAFRFSALPPGNYCLRVPRMSMEKTTGTAIVPVYYPDSPDQQGATTIRLRPGETFHAGVSATRPPAYHIKLTLLPAAAGRNVRIRLLQDGEDAYPYTRFTRDDDSTFDLPDVLPGAYMLQAAYTGNAEQGAMGELPVVVGDQDLTGVKLTLSPALSVSGVVVNPPEPRRMVVIETKGSNRFHWPSGMNWLVPFVRPDGYGAFQLMYLWPGLYDIDIPTILDHDQYVWSITSGPVDVQASGLQVGPAGAQPLRIQLSGGAASIDAKLAKAIPGEKNIVVGLRLKAGGTWRLGQIAATPVEPPKGPIAPTIRSEWRTLNSIAPGDYMVYAWPASAQLGYRDPAVLAAVSSHAVPVTLVSGEFKEVVVDVIPGEEVRRANWVK